MIGRPSQPDLGNTSVGKRTCRRTTGTTFSRTPPVRCGFFFASPALHDSILNNQVDAEQMDNFRMLKKAVNKAAASEMPRRTSQYVEALSDARTQLTAFFSILP